MDKSYSFKHIESKWQQIWEDNKSFKSLDIDQALNATLPKYYVLEMFPYPSGKIHMGHVRNYAIGDIIARYKKSKGFNVLHPMGWDAFGLPAENAAREKGNHPHDWTYQNINEMKKQFKRIGLSIDWDKELVTCDSSYYKHGQEIFIQLFKNNLAYKKESWVNWDPVENTVLANEQVIDGKGWRSGADIEQKKLNQWFLKITNFADDLLKDLELLPNWPSKVKQMQLKWIGKSPGAKVNFLLNKPAFTNNLDQENEVKVFTSIEIFTTRPETLFGASFIALSIQHPLSLELAKNNPLLADFIKKCQQLGTIEENITKEEKLGISTGLEVVNPINNNKIPVFIANYVLDYGTSAIFGCPAHDNRDFEFAKKYKLPIITVIKPYFENLFNVSDKAFEYNIDDEEAIDTASPERKILVNSDFLNGLGIVEAKAAAIDYLQNHKLGYSAINFRLKDWGISRQRYWGCPIPIVYCDQCGVVPEKIENLPIELPYDVNFDKPGNPLFYHPTWKHTKCPQCLGKATRETDTFDTFVESSWYFLRFATLPSTNAFDPTTLNYWLPVDQYIGGIEHAVMHLLYARFFIKIMAEIKLIPAFKEPFKALMTQGMICHKTYKSQGGKWLYPFEVSFDENNNPILSTTKEKVIIGRSEKMSKSKRNTVDPDEICNLYGADTARMFVLSDNPPEKELEWTEEGVEGIYKFINKLWKLIIFIQENSLPHKIIAENAKTPYKEKSLDTSDFNNEEKAFYSNIQKLIVEIEKNIIAFHFNKTIALNRELFNLIEKNKHLPSSLLRYAGETLIKLLNPFIPHICEELWQLLGHSTLLVNVSFPLINESYLKDDKVTIAIQIGGKTKGTLVVDKDILEEDLLKQIKINMTMNKHLENSEIKKVIYVPNKIINILL
ncbi:Leucine--tRNA ligase [Candidatus Hepatincolaceae symbiont of Richtersius coronifer]